ncbi:hypothetical protein EII17_03595 [Clostridiales bacterium COT073_COT-073]|nr:hypothetical protein EII17_03595 [Clostridiales bacterium COT073_COT-073]
MASFCTNCGKPVKDNAFYCTNCGNKIASLVQAQAPAQPSYSGELVSPMPPGYPTAPVGSMPSGYPAAPVGSMPSGYPAAPVGSMPSGYPGVPVGPMWPKPKKKYTFLKFVIVMAILVGLVYTGLYKPGWVHDVARLTKPMPEIYKQGSSVSKVIDNRQVCTVGTMSENGYLIEIEPGTFPDGTEITVEYVPIAQKKEKDFQAIGSPIRIKASGYKGGYLGEGVTVTMEIPERMRTDKRSRYFMAYFNEQKQDYEYYPFDKMDWENNVLTYTLPHFSENTPVLASKDKAVDVYLDAYCMQSAMNQKGIRELKESLGPELEKNLKKLGIPKEETADFINAIAGSIMDQTLSGTKGEAAGHIANLVTAGYKYKENKNADAFNEALTQTTCEVIAHKLLQAKFGKDISANPAKIIAGVTAKSGSIVGSLETGDYRQVVRDVGSVIISLYPTASVVNAVVDLTIASANSIKQNFKAAEVEKLYQMYKNGSGEFGARNFDDLWYSVDYSFWFSSGRGAYRFLKDDYVTEYCFNRGWKESQLKKLPAEKFEEINNFTRERLRAYFEERYQCEEAAEQMKKKEHRFIEDLSSTLDFSGYDNILGKDPMTRLNEIYRIRQFLTGLIDVKKQERADYAELVFEWIGAALDGKNMDEIKQHMVRFLKKKGLLKAGIEVPTEGIPTVSEICGTYQEVKGTLTVESSGLKRFADYMNETFGEGTVTGPIANSDTATMENVPYTFTIYQEDGKIKLKMIMNSSPNEVYLYACTYNESKGMLTAKLVSVPNDNAIQLGVTDIPFKFTKRGNMIYLHSDQNVNFTVGKFNLKFNGQKSLK